MCNQIVTADSDFEPIQQIVSIMDWSLEADGTTSVTLSGTLTYIPGIYAKVENDNVNEEYR